MLIATVLDLVSIVNKKAALPKRMAKNVARIAGLNIEYTNQATALHTNYTHQAAALSVRNLHQTADLDAENLEMQKELESIEFGGGKQSMVDASLSSIAQLFSKKRDRSAIVYSQ